MKTPTVRFAIACTFLLLAAVIAAAADQRNVSASIQSPPDRKQAPAFRLIDASGKTVRLSDYRGKVMLLDFWATECGGCKIEIPWYMQFEHAYKDKGLAVVGISMDIQYESLKDANEGWSRVKPFVQAQKVNYTILMGDDRVSKAYDIEALPATYLIDKNGRIAATYVGVLADKSNVEANINTLLMEH